MRATGGLMFLMAAMSSGMCSSTARGDDLMGIYLGGSVARARIDNDNSLYQTQQASQAANFGALDFTKAELHKENPQWWANVGYMLWPYVGIEASYLHFGELSNVVNGNYTPTGGSVQGVGLATLLRSNGPALGVRFRLPLTGDLDVNLRLADYYGHTALTNVLTLKTVTTTPASSNDSSLMAGVGVAYNFLGHWSARLDYLRVNKAGNSTKDVSYNAAEASAGISYTF